MGCSANLYCCAQKLQAVWCRLCRLVVLGDCLWSCRCSLCVVQYQLLDIMQVCTGVLAATLRITSAVACACVHQGLVAGRHWCVKCNPDCRPGCLGQVGLSWQCPKGGWQVVPAVVECNCQLCVLLF
jgi:hypothetical protein